MTTPEQAAGSRVCPTCGSNDPAVLHDECIPIREGLVVIRRPDPFHAAAATSSREESEPTINESSLSLDALHEAKSYLDFVHDGMSASGKTHLWQVRSKGACGGDLLGRVS